MDRDPALQALIDRQAITDTLYRYASSIDRKDYATVRAVFADDAVARYGERDEMRGADAIVSWIEGHGEERRFQHHFLSVYHIDIDGDTASALTYHTSHQITAAEPNQVRVIIARYHDQLRRIDGAWKITNKVMEVGWRETRHGQEASRVPQGPS